jgi:S1-C subfamily serine protease
MSLRHLAGLLLLPVAVCAQQPPRQISPSAPQVVNKSNAVVEAASQILDENRHSIAVIVGAGNTSLKLGTGFFVRSPGLLLTNFHVIEGMDVVGVKVPGSDQVLWAKKVTGFDLDNDLVLLEVDSSNVRPVTLGDSDEAKVGEQIVVVGNPEGLEETISNGLLSGVREVEGRKLLQISAPISEGSSGSPVFDTHGDVIGVVVSSLESGQNLNFAVPINYVEPLLKVTKEQEISALPKRDRGDPQSKSSANSADEAADNAKLAVQAMSKIAEQIRGCAGFSEIIPTKEKKPHYSRIHYDSPTDVRFDVKPNDSVVAPFEGILEFSIYHGVSLYLRTADQATSAPDNPMLSSRTRHRYFYRVTGSAVQLDYRTYFDSQQQSWVLQQGNSDACWDQIGKQ